MKNGTTAPPGYVLPNRPRWQGGWNIRSVVGAVIAFVLAASGATAVSDEQIERRALAYPIKKHNEANYVYVNFSGPPSIPEKFRYEMRHREGLMRMAFVCKPVPKPPVEPVETAAPEPDYPTAAVTPDPEVTDA